MEEEVEDKKNISTELNSDWKITTIVDFSMA